MVTPAAEESKSGRKKEHTASEMCFRLGSDRSFQIIHGANDEKYTKITKPGAEPGFGTKASAAAPATVDQPIIECDHTDGSSSKEDSEGESGDESSSGSSSSSTSSDEDEGQASQPAMDSLLQPPPLLPLRGR